MTDLIIAGVFPGQGSQQVGMGQELSTTVACVRDTFAEADAILGFKLSDIIFNGPAEELKRTSIAQPALLTMSPAYWRMEDYQCAVVAGHSLGEYSALVAAGALSLPDALQLVRKRGQLMEEAATQHPGGMAAILSLEDEAVIALCAEVSAEYGTVVPANFNSPGQVVVSGETAAIAAIRAAAKARGGRAIPLQVSGPFHSPLMQSAADAFAQVLAGVQFNIPSIPIVPNFTAAPTMDVEEIRAALAGQITGAVQWVKSLRAMHALGANKFIEIGPGNVLTGLVQRTLPDVETFAVSSESAG